RSSNPLRARNGAHTGGSATASSTTSDRCPGHHSWGSGVGSPAEGGAGPSQGQAFTHPLSKRTSASSTIYTILPLPAAPFGSARGPQRDGRGPHGGCRDTVIRGLPP